MIDISIGASLRYSGLLQFKQGLINSGSDSDLKLNLAPAPTFRQLWHWLRQKRPEAACSGSDSLICLPPSGVLFSQFKAQGGNTCNVSGYSVFAKKKLSAFYTKP